MLDASAVLGHIPDSLQDSVTADWRDVYDSAFQKLCMAGFDQRHNPPAVPFPDVTPEHYAHLEGAAYTDIMAQVDYWFARAKEYMGWVEAELICHEGEYKDIVREMKVRLRENAKTMVTKKSEMPTETELKEAAERQPHPRQLAQRIAELNAQKAVLSNCLEGLERFAAGLSRQVTIREQEIALTNFQTRGGYPGRFSR